MDASPSQPAQPSRLRLLLDHFSRIEDKRSPGSVAHKLNEILLLCVCATIADCDSFDAISEWGSAHLEFSAAFPAVRLGGSLGPLAQHHDEPDRSGPVRRLLHGLGSRLMARSSRHDRHRRQDRAPQPRPVQGTGRAASRLRLRHQQPSGSRTGGGRRQNQRNDRHPCAAREARRRPQPRRRRGHHRRHRLQSSDRPIHPRLSGRIICSPSKAISRPCRPTSRPPSKPPKRARSKSTSISTRATAASKPAPSRCCGRSIGSTATGVFPAKSASSTRARSSGSKRRTELKDRSRFDTRYYITSSARSAAALGQAIRGHWGIENTLHWTLDVTFQEDLSRVRKGHGAQNMALVRKFAFNKLRAAPPIQRPAEPTRQTLPTANQAAPTQKPQAPQKNRELGRQKARRNPHGPTRLSQINPDSEP